MKKFYLFIAAFACTSASLCAQTNSTVTSSPVSFGLKAGINLSNISVSEDMVDSKSKIGLNAGLFATFHVSESFGIQPELTWSNLGYKINQTVGGITVKGKEVMNYLTLPVLAKYTFSGSGFSLYAGPQIGVLLSAKEKPDEGESRNSKDDYKSTDFAGVAGLEFEIPNTKFNISGRYQFGLSNILDAEIGNYKVKNNAATFTVGYRLF